MVSYYICFNYGDDEYGYCEFRIMEAKCIQHLLSSHPLWPPEWNMNIQICRSSEPSELHGDFTQENCIAIDKLNSKTTKYCDNESLGSKSRS
jgi:hypothetical protein